MNYIAHIRNYTMIKVFSLLKTVVQTLAFISMRIRSFLIWGSLRWITSVTKLKGYTLFIIYEAFLSSTI